MNARLMRFSYLSLAIAIFLAPRAASAVTMVSNLPPITITQTGGTIFTNVWDASSFTTDASSYQLISATAHVSNETPGSTINYTGMLFSNSGGGPGTLLETLSTQPLFNGGGFVVTDLTFSSVGTLLAPNTTYWLGLRTDQPIGGAVAEFLGTFDATEVSPGAWTIGNSSARTLDAGDSGFGLEFAGQIAIEARAVPEPTSLALFAAGAIGVAVFSRWRRRK